MPKDSNTTSELSPETISEYLSHLGLENDPGCCRISSWESLQGLVAESVERRVRAKPILNTRLKTYGLDRPHPVRLLIRHVIS